MHNLADSSSPSVAVPYFQVPRDDWELLLVRMRQMGASVISTLVPWSWHAPAPDVCDFTGTMHPQRDLLGFIELCQRLGLDVVLQPGPFHSDELFGDDVPPWLLAQYPEIYALRPDGHPWRHSISGLPRVCALHPMFVQHARAWLAAFATAFAPYQHPSGPIVAIHLDAMRIGDDAVSTNDESDPRFRADYNPWILANLWPAWLRDTYHTSPADCRLPTAWNPPRTLKELRRYVDLSHFVDFCSHTALESHAEWLRVQGWQVPLVPRQRAASDIAVVAPQNLFEQSGYGLGPNYYQGGLVRSDGSVRPPFWHARGPLSLLDAADGDFARSHIPADLALGYSRLPEQVSQWIDTHLDEHRVLVTCADHVAAAQALAQRLAYAGVSFDVVDLDAASLEDIQRYRLVIAPASPVLGRNTQHKLAALSHLMLVGETPLIYDEQLLRCNLLSSEAIARLPESIDGAALGELAEGLGGFARYAWADADDVDVLVRYGATGATYVCVANRRAQLYSGMLAYRTVSGEIEHVHVSLGPQRTGLLLLRDNEVLGAALDGDASEGNWLVRGLRSSIVWSGGTAVVAPYRREGDVAALLVSAPHSGRLDLRRSEAWDNVRAYRLLFNGRALPAAFRTEGSHLVLPYIGEDTLGQTDAYLVLLVEEALPQALAAYLNTQLQARSSVLERNANLLLSVQQASDMPATLRNTSAMLRGLAGQSYTMQQYIEMFESAASTIQQITTRLAHNLRSEHGALAWAAPSLATDATIVERVLASLSRGI